jgi:transcriptional regulator with XRE-family HTH domain
MEPKSSANDPSSMKEKKVFPRFKQPPPRYYFKEWRKHRGLTQEKLGARVDLSASSISQIEHGKQGWTNSTLEALADALNCQPGDLLMRNPLDTEAPWSLWDLLKPAQRKQVVGLIEVMVKTGTDG